MTAARRAALLALPLLLAGGLLGLLAADPAKPDDPKADVLCPKGDAQFGSLACQACHHIDPRQPELAKEHPYAKVGSDKFVLLSEGKTFSRHDPHTLAFNALTGKLGTRMGEALKYDKDPLKWTACLTCHATDQMAGHGLHPGAKEAKPEERFNTSEGIGCVGCHGVRAEWQTAHYAEPKAKGGEMPWRDAKTPDAKEKAGMRDLRNPATKAQLCASCHVGSAELGRVVTHDMYAAGHPPLPPFELLTYQEGEPRHWERPAKLDTIKAYTGDAWKQFHYQKDETAVGREYAAGAVAALKAEAGMLEADARERRANPDKGTTLDFARFECSSCHHDLKAPSDRPVKDPPGRPPLRNSVAVPALLVAEHAAEKFEAKGEYAKKWAALKKAATDKPFGGDAVESDAKAVGELFGGLLDKIGSDGRAVYTPTETDALRAKVAEAAKAAGDPEAALVLAWGYRALGGEWSEEVKLPAGVRKPFDPKANEPAPIDNADRQDKLNKLDLKKFTEAFGKLK